MTINRSEPTTKDVFNLLESHIATQRAEQSTMRKLLVEVRDQVASHEARLFSIENGISKRADHAKRIELCEQAIVEIVATKR